MGMHRRLLKLERSDQERAPKAPCTGCGLRPGTIEMYRNIRVAFAGEPRGPTRCTGCGRQPVFTVEFDHAG